MTHSKTGIFKRWQDTEWKQLPNGDSVNVPIGEEIAIVSVVFVDSRERPRDFPLALNGREISHIEVNGVRYVYADAGGGNGGQINHG